MKSEYHRGDRVVRCNPYCEWWGCWRQELIPLLHRLDGPAFIGYNSDGSVYRVDYYLCDILVSKEDFETPGFIDAFILEHS